MRHLQREAYAPLAGDPPADEAAWRTESQIGLGLFERLRPTLLRTLAARDDSFLGEGRRWEDVFRRALALAVDELGEGLGRRTWGELHRFELQHPLSRLPFLRSRLGRGPFPMGGDADTVWQMSWLAARPYGPRLGGPSFRAVYDLSDPDGLWFAFPGGVSGSPRSRHYADLLPRWLAGELVQLRTAGVDGIQETLTPVSARS
jgi:penicillin amidase